MNKTLIVVTLTFAAAVCAHATATTHIWGPSTDVQAFNVWHITADYYLPTERTPAGARIPPVTNTGLTVGILPLTLLNAEVGIDHKSGLGPLDDYPLYFNGKIATPENGMAAFFPAVAVGIFDVGTRRDKTTNDVAYGEIAKTLGTMQRNLGRLSVGWFTGNKSLLLDARSHTDDNGVIAAWERTMNEISPKLWLCMEYLGTQSSYGTFNFGGSWKFADNMDVLLGYDVYNNADLPPTFTVQVDVDFSLKGK